jgi:hypothetical protein
VGTEQLVREQIDRGKALLTALAADGFVPSGYCWIKEDDETGWRLYLVSKDIDTIGFRPVYDKVRAALDAVAPDEPDEYGRLEMDDIYIVGDRHPIGRNILLHQAHWPHRRPVAILGRWVGEHPVKAAYVYDLPPAPAIA